MAKNRTQGNPRERLSGNISQTRQSPHRVDTNIAKQRATRRGRGAKSGNPRAKERAVKTTPKRESDLEGFSKANIEEIKQENKRQSRKLKKIQKKKKSSKIKT